MGYRVEYPGTASGNKRRGRVLVGTALCFAVFLLLVVAFWPQGAAALRRALLPGDPAVTAAALEDLAQGLRGGQDVREALWDFCRTVFREAGIVR